MKLREPSTAPTRDGVVRVSHPSLQKVLRDGENEKDDDRRRELRATMGAGGKTVRIRTGDGTIRIE